MNSLVNLLRQKRSRFWLWSAGLLLTIIFILVAGLAALPIVWPSMGAKLADLARSVVGPQPVAILEGVVFRVEDLYNQARYKLGAKSPSVTFSSNSSENNPDLNTANNAPVVTPTPGSQSVPPPPAGQPGPQGNAVQSDPRVMKGQTSPQKITNLTVVDAPPILPGGWEAFGSLGSGIPLMARSVVSPDPDRPYAQVALVRFDLSRTNLHLVPGRTEPIAAPGTARIPRPGTIPLIDQSPSLLLAGFNGGFKAVNGHFGMMVNGVTLLPPLDNLATLVIYQDGSVRIGAWGRDFTYTQDMVAYRQNCPLLIDAGQINPAVNNGNFHEWGETVKNVDATWRSGVGISQDGRFLIYAVGNSLTVGSLAQALQDAGSYYAMQMDINNFHIRFVSYSLQQGSAQDGLVAVKLIKTMVANPDEFLSPYDRDFFYVTVKP